MNAPSSVLVVGAGAAGLTVVECLRRKGYRDRVTLLGEEPGAPYDRPPLSKQVLAGTWDTERTHLRTRDVLDSLDAEFVLGERALALDTATRTVRTTSGAELGAGAVVLATGLHARRLPGLSGTAGVHVLPHDREPREVNSTSWTLADGLAHPRDKPGIGAEFDVQAAATFPCERKDLPVNRIRGGSLHDW
ncbi:FAD-dependent oxidoreductase [Streptomyces sp. NPDC051453]|uniref:FAD-dependent oxidoreductase n=1 Tax=Streptomyces sp. NPDC051453 TaxID=3154941 RepID=UPI00344926C9